MKGIPIIVQSGGATAVINASLAGAIWRIALIEVAGRAKLLMRLDNTCVPGRRD